MADKGRKSGVTSDVVALDPNDPIHVTPTNPLIINSTPVTYQDVLIEGGDIQVGLQVVANFGKLTKVS